ncbi:AI-2E family transporter [Bifidobacterium dolichotidis]|uniref:AI-2E family transporter n=1 Tax=Bifidobacterium dolichotidis TaxID=2306976 RepID=A0A430FQ02_9BIFI|nr:AI-2E family transporter [Bifidobacterium dolichotidis]
MTNGMKVTDESNSVPQNIARASKTAQEDLLEHRNRQPKLDLASIFPSKGDARRPPEWLSRALLYTVIAVFLAYFCFRAWFRIEFIVLDVVIALFLSLAVEPLVLKLIRHGWRRGVAAVTSLIGLLVIVVALLAAFGNLFVQQLISMLQGIPALYDQLSKVVEQYTTFHLPEVSSIGPEILKNIQTSWIANFAGTAVSTTVGLLGGLLNFTTAIMVAFYMSIAGPRLRRSICQWLSPNSQRRFLLTWTVVQDQISNYLFSRTILAACSAACTAIFLMCIHVPYWLPLALFSGIVSQFIPTIGTYLGGALPVLFAWGDRGIWYAVAVIIFITIYQQIENLLLSPKISERTMDINPCVAFLAVLVFGAIFGALGAFLALPITASLQVLFKVSTKRYELVDVPIMSDPEPKKKSRIVQAGEALSDNVAKRSPRAAKGSSANVPLDEAVRQLQEQIYGIDAENQRDEDSPTVAIPQRNQQRRRSGLLKTLRDNKADSASQSSDSEVVASSDSSDKVAQQKNNDFSDTNSADPHVAENRATMEENRGVADPTVESDAAESDNPRRSWK